MGRSCWLVVGLGCLALGCGGSSSDFAPKGTLDAAGDGGPGAGPSGGDGGQDIDSTLGPGSDGSSGGNPDSGVLPQGDSAAGEGGNALPDGGNDGSPGTAGDGSVDQSSPPGDASPADGALADGAGHIVCGASDCIEATQFCCVQADGGAACQQSGAACPGGARRSCEKAADCTGGEVCCFDFSTAPASASCRGDCNGGGGTRVQACATQAECVTGTCATHSCTAGGSIESCTGSAACP